jgi:hypothetical protein
MKTTRILVAGLACAGSAAAAEPRGPTVMTHEVELTNKPPKFGGRVALDAVTLMVSSFDPPSLSGSYGV